MVIILIWSWRIFGDFLKCRDETMRWTRFWGVASAGMRQAVWNATLVYYYRILVYIPLLVVFTCITQNTTSKYWIEWMVSSSSSLIIIIINILAGKESEWLCETVVWARSCSSFKLTACRPGVSPPGLTTILFFSSLHCPVLSFISASVFCKFLVEFLYSFYGQNNVD